MDCVEIKVMFRAQVCQVTKRPTLKLEGRLVGAWAEQAKDLFIKETVPRGLVIDLTDVRLYGLCRRTSIEVVLQCRREVHSNNHLRILRL